MNSSAVKFQNVSIVYANGFRAVNAVSFEIEAGECLAIIGESGSGKTTIANAALGLLPADARVTGSILIGATEIVGAAEKTLRGVRGITVGFVAQSPFSAFNPLMRVYRHIAESWLIHRRSPPRDFIIESLENCGIVNAAEAVRNRPHQWSGGMLQRAEIVAATAHQPALIIADEPTSALDQSRAREILINLRSNSRETAVLLISHDINLAAKHANRIAVCRRGEIVEINRAEQIIENPQHWYTKLLLAAVSPKRSTALLENNCEVVLQAKDISRVYQTGANRVNAVVNASLQLRAGEIVGICGESGSGKSTLLRLLMRVEAVSSGAVYWSGEDARSGGESAKITSPKARPGFVMPIFQNPLASLDERWAIWRSVTEPLTAPHRKQRLSKSERCLIARECLTEVGLGEIELDARPKELSIGQCQRVCIARALVANPKIILADEPTSALDAVAAAETIKLITAAASRGIATVVVSHDELMLKNLSDRVFRMRGGVLEN